VKGGTLSLRYVLLGLLSENSGHGYGLRKMILHRMSHFRQINEGQLYTELARMEKEGLTEHEVEVPDKGPARKLIHITPRGREAFLEWLRSDQYEEDGILYDFIQGYPFFTKCTFLNHLDGPEALAKIGRQIAILEKKKEAYQEILPRMKKRGADRFRVRILEYGVQEMEHRIRWMEEMTKELQPEAKVARRK
jgi:DNA-binding PadR family transcriptional regulator